MRRYEGIIVIALVLVVAIVLMRFITTSLTTTLNVLTDRIIQTESLLNF